MGQSLVGAVLVEEPLEFEFVGGLFYIRGIDGPIMAMRPNTFFATVAAAATEGRKFRFCGAEIIPFAKDRTERH